MYRSSGLSLIHYFSRGCLSRSNLGIVTILNFIFVRFLCNGMMTWTENGKVTLYCSHLCGTFPAHGQPAIPMSIPCPVLYSQSASPSRAWIEKGVAAVGITEQGLFIHWLDRSTMDRASERANCLFAQLLYPAVGAVSAQHSD